MVREPVVAGRFYEGDKNQLESQLESCFTSGPGLPKGSHNKEIIGAISPHAGYMCSGMGASYVYKRIAESKKLPQTFVIIGPNHTGLGRTSLLLEDFRTPLGIAKVDTAFGKLLLENKNLENSPLVHMNEHSIEVQLPFLQYTLKDFMFLPIVISSYPFAEELAKALCSALKQTKRRVCIIASGDFTHYGPSYGFAPFRTNITENVKKLDFGAIELIKKLDDNGLNEYIQMTGATICGYLPIITLIKTVKLLGIKPDVKLLKYYTSGDVFGDHENSVSYASMVMEQ